MLNEILIVVGLILVNGIFSGAEIAIVTLRKGRVREMAEGGSRSGKALLYLRENPERFLSTVQVGITVVGAAAAAFGGSVFAERLAPSLAGLPWIGLHAGQVALVLVVLLISFLSIVLGELVPKSLGLRSSEGYARVVAQPIVALSVVAKPIVWLLTGSSNLVLRLFGDHTSFTETRLSLEELRGMVDEASEGGSVPEEAGEIASRALEFAGLVAADVMIHRRFVAGIPIDADAATVRRIMIEAGHRRTPVYQGSLDGVQGYVSWRDVLQKVWDGAPVDLRSMLRPCPFVPETTPAHELLETMRSQRQQIAVVVDEHGGTAGIVTLEDLLEELVGDIVSEHDPLPADLSKLDSAGSVVVAGSTSIREVNHALEVELPEPSEWTTVGGLTIELAGGRIPRTGEQFTLPDGTRIEIVEATPRRVRRLRVVPRRKQVGASS
ncbi:MAG: hemolysin family protein [Planctomycetota bacterium]